MATMPDTIGAANDVPLTKPKSLLGSPFTSIVVRTETPGAVTRMEAPGVLNGAICPSGVDAATVISLRLLVRLWYLVLSPPKASEFGTYGRSFPAAKT